MFIATIVRDRHPLPTLHYRPHKPRILMIDGGSSSIKFALLEAGDSLRRILEGAIERVGLPAATWGGHAQRFSTHKDLDWVPMEGMKR